MMLKNSKIFGKMKELGALCVTPIDETIEERFRYGFRSYSLSDPKPKYLANNNSLVLNGKINLVFSELINLFSKEPETEHLTPREIEDNLVKFLLHVLDGNDSVDKITSKVKQTIKEMLLPHVSWFVYAPLNGIDSKLEINFDENNFIKKITDTDFSCFFFNTERSKEDFNKHYNNKTTIFVSVMANNANSALTKGQELINQYLDMLQFNFGDDYFHSITKPNVFTALRKDKQTGRIHWFAIGKPICSIDSDKKDEINEMSKFTNTIFSSTNNSKIKRNLLTAIRWFSDATHADNLDDKLSKYFIALEALLLPETLGSKGERLTYRITLLWVEHKALLQALTNCSGCMNGAVTLCTRGIHE